MNLLTEWIKKFKLKKTGVYSHFVKDSRAEKGAENGIRNGKPRRKEQGTKRAWLPAR